MLPVYDAEDRGAIPEIDVTEREEKDTRGCVNHSVGWFQKEKFNFISYTFHILWKEVLKVSTWCSGKETTDFPMACRKLRIFK